MWAAQDWPSPPSLWSWHITESQNAYPILSYPCPAFTGEMGGSERSCEDVQFVHSLLSISLPSAWANRGPRYPQKLNVGTMQWGNRVKERKVSAMTRLTRDPGVGSKPLQLHTLSLWNLTGSPATTSSFGGGKHSTPPHKILSTKGRNVNIVKGLKLQETI